MRPAPFFVSGPVPVPVPVHCTGAGRSSGSGTVRLLSLPEVDVEKSVLSDIPQAQTFFLIVYTMIRVLRLLLQTVEYLK